VDARASRPGAVAAGNGASAPPSNAIECRGLSKKYKIYSKYSHRLIETLAMGRVRLHEEQWALRDVTLAVPKQTTLGIVGSNGAGKSTLLKVLTGTTYPTGGGFHVDGRVSALLDLGIGFHLGFTGRDNVSLNASLLGLSREEIAEKVASIIEFSELADVIDRPIRTYSTGMLLRLGFSVAIALQPDVLFIDEILAVGDLHFQKKCIDRIHAHRESGRTILFCSHAMVQVRQICERVIWLDQGRVRLDGDPIAVTNEYSAFERARHRTALRAPDGAAPRPVPDRRALPAITHAVLRAPGSSTPVHTVRTGDDLEIHVCYDLPDPTIGINIGVLINRADDIECFGASCEHDDVVVQKTGYAVIRVRNLRLLAGEFIVRLYLVDDKSMVVYDQSIDDLRFKVEFDGYQVGLFRADVEWEFREGEP
jgi:lipopolysaccharide transport system ATP-binding protein